MKLTKNELLTFCKRAYRGHYQGGEPDKIAQIVLNNELMGLSGIHCFVEALQKLNMMHALTINASPTYQHSPNWLCADLHRTILIDLPIWLDVALEKMLESTPKEISLQLNHASERWLVVGGLMEMRKQNLFSAQAIWCNHSQQITCLFDQGSIFPNIVKKIIKKNSCHSDSSITITLKKNGFFETPEAKDRTEFQSADEIENHYQNTFNRLILIPNQYMKVIVQSAKKILVKNTVQSIKGAGE